MVNRFRDRRPFYPDDSDYNTNAPSYYDDLARKSKLIKLLAKRVWEYDKTLNRKLEEIETTLTEYINQNDELLQSYMDKWDERIENLDEEVEHIFIEWLNDGTLEYIINHEVLGNKADKTSVANSLQFKRDKNDLVGYSDLHPDLLSHFENPTNEGSSINVLSTPNTHSVTTNTLNKDVIGLIPTDLIDLSTISFDIGTLDVNFGTGIPGNNRVRSERILLKQPSVIYLTSFSNAKLNVFKFDTENNFIGHEGIGKKEIYVEEPGYIRILIGYSDDREVTSVNELKELLRIRFTAVDNLDIKSNSITDNKIRNGVISAKKTNYINVSSNHFNQRTITDGRFLSLTEDRLSEDLNYVTSDFIPIEELNPFTTAQFNRIGYYDQNKKRLRVHDILTPDKFDGQMRENEVFIRLSGLRSRVLNAGQVNVGTELLPYEPYYLEIPDLMTEITTGETYYFTPENLSGRFETGLEHYSDGRIDLETLYQQFDQLMRKEPDYMTKHVFGKDESGLYDVVEYRLKPKQILSTMPPLPKIIFISNSHGEEKGSTFAVYHFLDELINNWENNPLLEYLRHHVEFAFIPVLNPWGFVNESYKNVNGVNIQVNMPIRWSNEDQRGNPYSHLYAGEKALSEVESQYAKQFIDSHKDAMHFVDLHTQNGTSENGIIEGRSLVYSLLDNSNLYNRDMDICAKSIQEEMNIHIPKKYGITSEPIGMIQKRIGKGAIDIYAEYVGIPSLVQEHFYNFPGESFYTPEAKKANTEYLTNWFLTVIKHFKHKHYMSM